MHTKIENSYKIIILNGGSSVGKSSIAKEFVNINEFCYYNISMDSIYEFLPSKYYNFDKNAKITAESKKGFWNDNGNIGMGEYAKNISVDLWHIIKSLAQQKRSLILDLVSFETKELLMAGKLLKEHLDHIYIVRVFCEIEELKKREIARGDRPEGVAEKLQPRIDTEYNDFVIDSTSKTPKECGYVLNNYLQNSKPNAMQKLLKENESI